MADELETKAADEAALSGMAGLLADVKAELSAQFQTFAALRDEASRRSQPDLPEAEAKLVKADLKAAVDALNIIVRTLEKVDQLARQIAADRAELALSPDNRAAHDALLERVNMLIAARVEEALMARLAARTGSPGEGSGGADAAGPLPEMA